MKKTILLATVLALTGCTGLNVSWSVVATYNTPHATPGQPVAVDSKAEPAK
jgi:hypothetical protein